MNNKMRCMLGLLIIIHIESLCINMHEISQFVKNTGTLVTKALSRELIPAGLKLHWHILINTQNSGWVRLLSLYTLANILGISYIPALCEINITDGLKIRGQLQPLSQYHNARFENIQAMARAMGLDPEKIYVAECDSPGIGHATAQATETFTKNILLIDTKPENPDGKKYMTIDPDEHTFIIGHELTHIKHHHILKDIACKLLAPWIVRASLIIGDTLAQIGLSAIAQKFNMQNNQTLHIIKSITHFMLRNPLMEALYANRFITYYLRSQEKQADIESAKKFNCAAAGISLFKKIDALGTQKYSRIKRLWMQFKDTHPTNAERICYLKKIAEQQEQVICDIITHPIDAVLKP